MGFDIMIIMKLFFLNPQIWDPLALRLSAEDIVCLSITSRDLRITRPKFQHCNQADYRLARQMLSREEVLQRALALPKPHGYLSYNENADRILRDIDSVTLARIRDIMDIRLAQVLE